MLEYEDYLKSQTVESASEDETSGEEEASVDEETGSEDTESEPEGAASLGLSNRAERRFNPLYIVIPAVLLAGVVVWFLLSRKKKDDKS